MWNLSNQLMSQSIRTEIGIKKANTTWNPPPPHIQQLSPTVPTAVSTITILLIDFQAEFNPKIILLLSVLYVKSTYKIFHLENTNRKQNFDIPSGGFS